MNFEELQAFLKEIKMNENYQPVIIKSLLESEGYTQARENIIEDLREANNRENRDFSQILWEVINTVLNKPERKMIGIDGDICYLEIDDLTKVQEKTLIDLCNYNIDKIRADKSAKMNRVNYWIWSVTPENWEIVKSKKIWASRIPENIRTRIRPSDKVIFYVQGTGEFQGIFEFEGEWYDAKEPVWSDETDSVIYSSQIKLKPVKLGHVDVYGIASKLKVFPLPADKRMINLVLKGGAGYPSNNGKPILSEDYFTILNSMVTEPGIEVSSLSDLIEMFDKDRRYFDAERISEEEREKTRERFVREYSPSLITHLVPEEYAIWVIDPSTGKYKRNFCYRLVNEIKGFGGIGGPSADGYGIWWSKSSNNFGFNRKRFQTLDQAFSVTKNEINNLLTAGSAFSQTGDWKSLSKSFEDCNVISSLFRSRLLSVYYPVYFVGIHSAKKANEILEIFGRKPITSDEWAIKQSELLGLKNSHPIMKNWSNEDFREFVWNVWKRKMKSSEEVEEEKVEEISFDDLPLPIPTAEELRNGHAKIIEMLMIPEGKITEIVTALASGRHVLLAGPIGTGKTEIAKLVPKIFWEKYGGYYSEDFTATSDWSTQDVIGGIFPKMNEDGDPIYEIQNGCVVETVSKNWKKGTDGGHRIFTQNPAKDPPYRGTWLIIDEFNRADIDKAFGQLFTALRTYTLKIPTDREGQSYKTLKIPNDYRIIGTLNTQDKHFLFQLSDALKSRFAYIEIDIPEKKELEQEIYYTMKRALQDLRIDDHEDLIALDHQNKRIDREKSNEEFVARVYQAYDFLDLVRMFKKLGTAILKLVYQNMITGARMGIDLKIVLDNALTSNLIPQLENLPHPSIGTIHAMYSGDVVKFFKDAYNSPSRQSYADAFSKIISYLELQNSQRLASEFVGGTLQVTNESMWVPIQNSQEKKKKELGQNLSQLLQSMEILIKSMAV